MAASDIQRLRQQALFSVAPQQDMMGSMGDGGGYEMGYMAPSGPMGGAYRPPPMEDYGGGIEPRQEPSNPFDFLKPQQPSPTFPSGGAIAPGQTPADPNKTAAGSTPMANQTLQEYIDAINKGYTPDFTDRDRLRKLMDEVPERGSPSLARSIVAAAMSTKAEDPVKMADQVQYAPYYRDKADWLSKTEPFYKTADLENRQNINERTLMTGAITAKTQADRLLEQGRQADQKNEIARQRAENDAIRARAYAAKNNGFTVMKAGDRIVAVDPATNRRMDLGPSGGLDRETELDIMGEWGVKQAEARGTAAVQTAQAGAIANNRDVVTIDGITYRRQEDGSFAPAQGLPRGTPTRPGTPPRTTGAGANTLENRRRIQDELKERWQTDRSGAGKYITVKPGGVYDWKPRPVPAPAGMFPWSADEVTEADVAEYDALRKEVDPSYTPPVAKPTVQPGGSIGGTTPTPGGGGRGGGSGLGPTNPPGGRGGTASNPKTVTKREYSPSRNQTRITYSDGTTSIVAGKQ